MKTVYLIFYLFIILKLIYSQQCTEPLTDDGKPILNDWGFELIGNDLESPWKVSSNDIKFYTADYINSFYTLYGYYYARYTINATQSGVMTLSQVFTTPNIVNDNESYILEFSVGSDFFILPTFNLNFSITIDSTIIGTFSKTTYYGESHSIDITNFLNTPFSQHEIQFVLDYSIFNNTIEYNNNFYYYRDDTTSIGYLLSNVVIMRKPKSGILMASDVYVNIRNGSDKLGNGTLASPFSSIAMALAWIQSGYTIYLSDEVYCGYYMSAQFKISSEVNIAGTQTGNSILYGQFKIKPFFFESNNASVTLSNLVINNTAVDIFQKGAVVLINANNILALNNITILSAFNNFEDASISIFDNATVSINNCLFKLDDETYNFLPSMINTNSDNARIYIRNSTFINFYNFLNTNRAASITIESSKFIDYIVNPDGTSDFKISCALTAFRTNITVINSTFDTILASVFCIIESSATFIGCSFNRSKNDIFYLTGGTLDITNSTFVYNITSAKSMFTLSETSKLMIFNCWFMELDGGFRGTLFTVSQSTLFFKNSSITSNTPTTLFSVHESLLSISENLFYGIDAPIIDATKSSVEISNCEFNSIGQNEIITFNSINTDGLSVVIENCTFVSLTGMISLYDTYLKWINSNITRSSLFFQSLDNSRISVINSHFSKLRAVNLFRVYEGSVLYVVNSQFTDSLGTTGLIFTTSYGADVTFFYSLFANNYGYTGTIGSIYDHSIFRCIGCKFYGNTAENNGGVLLLQGSGSSYITNSVFSDNTCLGGGGVAYFETLEPTFINCTFYNNSAKYGDIIATKLDRLFLTIGEFPTTIDSNKTLFTGVIKFGDALNQTSQSRFDQTIYLQLSGNTIASAPFFDGSAIFMNIVVIGEINSTNVISFISNDRAVKPLSLPYTSKVLPCSPGHYPTSSSTICSECPPGSYGYDGYTCVPCPLDAICAGVTEVANRPGYWYDKDIYPRVLYQCDYLSRCLENNTCSPHTYGILCSSCNRTEDYYSWMGNCLKCTKINPLIVVAISIGMVLIVLWSHKSDSSSGIMNIVVYFSQTVMVLAKGINFSILALMNLQLESGGSSIIGSVCPGPFDFYQRHYMTFLVAPILAGILIFCTFIIWLLKRIFHIKQQKQNQYQVLDNSYITTLSPPSLEPKETLINMLPNQFGALVKILLTVYSPFSTNTFNMFFCQNYGNDSVLMTDSSVQCKGDHYNTALKISYGMLTVVLGLPIVVFILLFRNRKHLTEEPVKKTYGVFYLKYKPHFYYWDVVLLFRRLIIVVVSIMDQQTPIRSLLLILVSIISLLLQIGYSPYVEQGDNNLELVSLILLSVCCIYLGNEVENYVEDWIVILSCIIFGGFLCYTIYKHYRLGIIAKINHYLAVVSNERFGYLKIPEESHYDQLHKKSNENDHSGGVSRDSIPYGSFSNHKHIKCLDMEESDNEEQDDYY